MKFEEFFETQANFDWVDTDNISEKLNKIGVSITNKNGSYRNFSEVISDISKKLNNKKDEGENEMINIGDNNTIVNSEINECFKYATEAKKLQDKAIETMNILENPKEGDKYINTLDGKTYKFTNNEWKIIDMTLQVRYIDKNITPMVKTEKGDLVDLRVSRAFKIDKYGNKIQVDFPCKYEFGDTLFFKLGFAMKMPPNKKSNVYPRSGMFANYGFLLTNSVGQIDNKFQGNDDEWGAMVWCTRDGEINYDDRILQFEVVDRVMENVKFEIVEQLGEVNRGGYSSTGVR